MVDWLALAAALLAIAVAVVAAGYTRRQAVAAEDANWSNDPPVFEATVVSPHSGAAQLHVLYRQGVPVDDVQVEIVNVETGPMSGFGAGLPESPNWPIGPARVGQSWSRQLAQRPSVESGGPSWQGGSVALRISCRRGRHSQDIAMDVELPSQPWVY